MTDAITILQNKLSSSEVRQVLLALGHPELLKQFEIQNQIQQAGGAHLKSKARAHRKIASSDSAKLWCPATGRHQNS